MSTQLLVVAGPEVGRRYSVKSDNPLVIGRASGTAVRLTDPHVSRRHCQVVRAGDRVMVEDLASVAGTFVNGQRVTKQILRTGDVLGLGRSQLRLECGAPARPEALPEERLHELSGTTLSHYTLGPVVARGRTGLVFRARDTKHQRDLAFKVLWPQFSRDRTEVHRFIRAVRTLMPLEHVNLVATYGAGKTGPYCWVAMEYVEGTSLAQLLQQLGPGKAFGWRSALRVAVQVSRALASAHHHAVVHRNVTPRSILLRPADRLAKLSDFLAAKALEGELAQDLTPRGEVIGDVAYLSPEQTTGGAAAVDARSDLYSLGATVYTLLAGRPPLEGKSPVETILKVRREAPPPLRQFQPALPAAVEAAVLRLLAKRPEDRFQSAAELLDHLQGLLGPG